MTKSVMERSHAKLTQWAMAFHLYAASKKGFTATSYSVTLAASTTRRGSCITASWKRCAVAASISRRWAAPARSSRSTRRITATSRVARVHAAPGPSLHKGRQEASATSARSFRWSTRGRQRSLVPCPDRRRGDGRQDRARERASRKPPAHRRKQPLHQRRPGVCRPRNRQPCRQGIRARRRDDEHSRRLLLASSSAGCAATISIAPRRICIAIWRNSISATTLATLPMVNVRRLRFAAAKASVSRIVNLTKPDFKLQAARFMPSGARTQTKEAQET